jgi:Peptidase A4 family
MRAKFGMIGVVLAAATFVGPTAASTATTVVHAPRLAAKPPKGGGGGGSFGWASSNWSGYAVSGGPYTSVTGSWQVPTVSPTSANTYSSNWLGIDGFNNSSLIQTGTEQDWVNGVARYYAWWEILPAAETPIPSSAITVSPGDTMTASITQGSPWTITITDTTTGASFTTAQSYSGPLTSAEWIEEAPTVGGRVAPLAHYGTTVFDPGAVNGNTPALITADGGVMIQHRAQVSTPSLPDGDTDGFGVQYGASVPSAPSS